MKLLKIKSRQDFLKIQNHFKIKWFSNNFLILIIETDEKYIKNVNNINNFKFIRLGIAVTKKIDKRAVIRNNIKRKIRENIRILLKENNDLFINFCDYEIIAKKSFLDVSHIDLKNEFIDSLKKAKEKYEQQFNK